MLDNSISDPTKQIWINLELYFESYEFFYFFLNLFEILMNFFGIFWILMNLKSIYLI